MLGTCNTYHRTAHNPQALNLHNVLLSTGYISRTSDFHYLFEKYTSYSILLMGKSFLVTPV